MVAKHKALIFAVISVLFWGGLEVSGYTNLPLAIGLWAIAGGLFLWWLWHYLPENPFQRKFMGPLILIGVGVVCIAGGGVWYLTTADRRASNDTSTSETEKHPLKLIYPSPEFIRTQILSLEGDGQKIVYKNFHLIGVQNPQSSKKSIKRLRLKMWLFDAPGDLKLSGEDKTIVDLNPGDIAFFEVGYFLSRSLVEVPIGGTALPQKEFEILYHNARKELEAFRFETGKGKSTYTIFLKQLKNPTEPTSVTVQFSANDTPPLIVDIFAYWDAKHGVRLEALVKD